jgi:branched-subunit amino acid ABC-type transport system permease component
MDKITEILRFSIVVLFQIVLGAVLIALLLGEAAGPTVSSILSNTERFLSALNPAAAAVGFVLYLIWLQLRPQGS